MRGRSAERFFGPEDRANGVIDAEMRTALEAGRASDERWHLRQDGTRFWANGEMLLLHDTDGVWLSFLKILRDRTREHEEAAANAADAEFMRSVLASSNDCIKVLDLDARLEFMSEGGQQVMEVSDFKQLRGCAWPSLWESGSQDDVLKAIADAKSAVSGAGPHHGR